MLLVTACAARKGDASKELLPMYLQERIAATNEEFDERGVFLRSSPYREKEERLFYRLLEDDTPAADEAVAHLLFLYVGEHPGEELVCDVARRGDRMLPIIERFSRELPTTGLEPYPKFIQDSGTLAPMVAELIRKGEKCEPYD